MVWPKNTLVGSPMELSANQQIELARIKTGIAIVFPAQVEKREPVLVSSKDTVLRLVQVDEAAFHHEHRYHRLWRVLGND